MQTMKLPLAATKLLGQWQIEDAEERPICVVDDVLDDNDDENHAATKDHASRIVLAVNSFEAMRQALEACPALPIYYGNLEQDGPALRKLYNAYADWHNTTREAALALAHKEHK